jgi:hypothetical protein
MSTNKNSKHLARWTTSLASYGMAASALGAVSLSAQAAEQPFDPVGGLPISLDEFVNMSVDIDIDGDTVDDFTIYRETSYGGGFGIGSLVNGDAANKIQAPNHSHNPFHYQGFVRRHDSGETVSEGGYEYFPGYPALYEYGAQGPGQSSSTYIDLVGKGGDYTTFTPFRGNPGFISLVLRPDSGTNYVTPLIPRIAWIEVVVSPDGKQLQILSGAWEDEDYVNQMLLPAVTPPTATGLAELALGDQ